MPETITPVPDEATPIEIVEEATGAVIDLLKFALGGDGTFHHDLRPGERVGLLIVPNGVESPPEVRIVACDHENGGIHMRAVGAIRFNHLHHLN